MPLVTQATYARRRGVSREAVRQHTTTNGGPIPVHGPRKLIDVEEADALWEATTSPAGASPPPRAEGRRAEGSRARRRIRLRDYCRNAPLGDAQ